MSWFDSLSQAGDRFLETGTAAVGNVFDALATKAQSAAFDVFDYDEPYEGVGIGAQGVTPAGGVPIHAATERTSIPSTFVQPATAWNPFAVPRPDISESPNSHITSSGSNPGAGVGGVIFGIPTAYALGGAAILGLGAVVLLKR